LNFQQLCGPLSKIPRPVWTTVATIIYMVCAIAGRAHLLTIFLNFLGLIGYWVVIWIAIVAEDEFIFRRKTGYNWSQGMDRKSLPVGVAALVSFLIGWAGAIVCMGQTYYYGPIARMVGDYGADVSTRCSFSLSPCRACAHSPSIAHPSLAPLVSH
jgi:purine-cytosine permease-like protein